MSKYIDVKNITRILNLFIVSVLLGCGNQQKHSEKVTIEFRLAETTPVEGLSEMIIQSSGERFFLHQEVLLSNSDIASASVKMHNNRSAVELILTDTGRDKLAEVTQENINNRMGMLIDGKLVSAPLIQAPIRVGKAIIDGGFSENEALRIVRYIESGRKIAGRIPRFHLKDAKGFMHSYMAALRTGDKSEISSFWSKISLNREGFGYMHLWIGACLPISEWTTFFEENDYTYHINSVSTEKDHYIIHFDWIEGDTSNGKNESETHPMRYYIVWEDEEWVLINPIDILTRDWSIYESEYFIFHYPAQINIEDHFSELHFMDRGYEKLIESLHISPAEKIEYYKARTPRKCGDLVCFPPANGYCARGLPFRPNAPQWFHIVISTSFINLHEVTHLLVPDADLYSINAAFDEGIAVAFGGTTFQTAEYALIRTRNAIGQSDYVPLETFLTDEAHFWKYSFITYQEAGAFVRFLIDRFGIEKLKKLCNDPEVGQELAGTIQKIYGFSIKKLEQQFKEYLSEIDVPEVEYSAPDNATLVFSMTDPENDDNGDGDYEYPADKRFEKGVFDLREFSVLTDTSRVYFRLRFQNMIGPVNYDDIEEKFLPGTVIAICKKRGAGRHVQKYFDGVRFEQDRGYDIKLTVGFGITASNNFGKVYYTTGDNFSDLSNIENNTISFSIPIDFIGKPHKNWGYFVGVGLMGDRTMHFTGGPMPVYKDHRLFIRGGNHEFGNPAFIDILLPEERNQKKMLSDYDPGEGKLAVVPIITQR
ncbi:MAG: hypothetical protein JSV84_09070 [Gemmatimonadota bacterium]|nr:MAG: hypothetical protein JSV84_09070 [Gemmatimonadota bacterium]